MKKYKLGEVVFEFVFENEMGKAYRTKDKDWQALTFYEHQLIKLGATPIDEPEEEGLKEINIDYINHDPRTSLVEHEKVINQLIKAVKQLQEER